MTNWNKEIYPEIVKHLDYLDSQGIIPTLRAMFYHLYNKGVIKNTKNAYRYLSKRTAQWRRNSIFLDNNSRGSLPIDCFSDDKRVVIRDWNNYIKPADYVKRNVDSLAHLHEEYPSTIPRWYKQPHYVEVWIEKNAMVTSVQKVLEGKQVRIVPSSGYSSVTFMHENMTRLSDVCEWKGIEGMVHVLYLGDMDPSGEDIDIFTEAQLKEYGLLNKYRSLDEENWVDFKRVGVTMDQIRRFNLPTDPDAETLEKLKKDPRGKAFMNRHQGELFQVEVDALQDFAPEEFKRVLLEPIDNWFREDIYKGVMNDKAYSEEALKELQKKEITRLYNEVVKGKT